MTSLKYVICSKAYAPSFEHYLVMGFLSLSHYPKILVPPLLEELSIRKEKWNNEERETFHLHPRIEMN